MTLSNHPHAPGHLPPGFLHSPCKCLDNKICFSNTGQRIWFQNPAHSRHPDDTRAPDEAAKHPPEVRFTSAFPSLGNRGRGSVWPAWESAPNRQGSPREGVAFQLAWRSGLRSRPGHRGAGGLKEGPSGLLPPPGPGDVRPRALLLCGLHL